ncbi:hypothetical protein [Polaribacter sp. Z022]|uniref:hypothetical protein n=1 Tax=Polaribacter sp. Z022 TaxID=2927125 RepID=UPI002020A2C8|nr:hypothetical protein [Polaribacter sp. Z022]MCL7755170.1 hypothetical protein [Polaribacter sp. Z022]
MNKKNLNLLGGIFMSLKFISKLFDTESETFFGFSVNIWVLAIVYFLAAISFFGNYYELKKNKKK